MSRNLEIKRLIHEEIGGNRRDAGILLKSTLKLIVMFCVMVVLVEKFGVGHDAQGRKLLFKTVALNLRNGLEVREEKQGAVPGVFLKKDSRLKTETPMGDRPVAGQSEDEVIYATATDF